MDRLRTTTLALILALMSWLAGLGISEGVSAAERTALTPVRPERCGPQRATCEGFDAVVFVHGIYGDVDTFKNQATHFDWAESFPSYFEEGQLIATPPGESGVDVFRLTYQTELFSWAKGHETHFDAIARKVFEVMKPLRVRRYRSIGFIAHSLGGNIVSTYIHMVKSSLGHPQRSQHAFVVNLATPVLGSQIADIGSVLTSALGMNDALLKSLKENNLYLTMLDQFRREEQGKAERNACRAVHLHAAYETKYIGPLLVVTQASAAASISQLVSSPVVGFTRNHFEMAKPSGVDDPLYKWVDDRVRAEYSRLLDWDTLVAQAPPKRKMCASIDYIPE